MNKGLYLFLISLGILTWSGFLLIKFVNEKLHPLPVYGPEDHKIESFELINQKGELISSSAQEGKIWVVNYFFTSCPSVCPKMMRNMQEVHNIFRSDEEVILMSFTVDPKRDQPERFMRYLDRFNINHDTWQLVTGPKPDLYRLARRSFLVSATDGGGGEYDFIHSENIVIIDQHQQIRGIVNGVAENADQEIFAIIKKLKRNS